VDIPLKNDMRVLLIPKLRLDGIHIIARSFIVRQSKTIRMRFLRFFEIALVLVRFDHVASVIANADQRHLFELSLFCGPIH
jgi:hypothetical protein